MDARTDGQTDGHTAAWPQFHFLSSRRRLFVGASFCLFLILFFFHFFKMRFPLRLEVTRSELMQAKRFRLTRRRARALASFVGEARRLALADWMGRSWRQRLCQIRFFFFFLVSSGAKLFASGWANLKSRSGSSPTDHTSSHACLRFPHFPPSNQPCWLLERLECCDF